MIAIAEWAGIPKGGFKRMVLVLDIDDIPRLYTEGLIRHEEGKELQLPPCEVKVAEKHVEVDLPEQQLSLKVADITTQQNEKWRTRCPVKARTVDVIIVDDPVQPKELSREDLVKLSKEVNEYLAKTPYGIEINPVTHTVTRHDFMEGESLTEYWDRRRREEGK